MHTHGHDTWHHVAMGGTPGGLHSTSDTGAILSDVRPTPKGLAIGWFGVQTKATRRGDELPDVKLQMVAKRCKIAVEHIL